MRKFLLIPLLGALLVGSACSMRYATSTSDTMVCVYDGSQRGGQKLKFQVPPGAKSKGIDSNDQVVKIPASNRFFMASTDDAVRDPLAPKSYEAFAKGSVAVQIQGQVRFRFNLEKACEWYSKHGRRNANGNDLGFNARGDDARDAGWFRFLAENFGVTMAEVAKEVTGKYDWAALTFNYPANANDAGEVPAGQQPAEAIDLALGRELGVAFTNRLNANLGGDYFCGIDPDPNGATNACPPMRFQVIRVDPTDTALRDGRQKVEATKQALRDAELEGQLQQAQQAAIIASENAKAAILEAQAKNAETQARIDTAKCRQYAQYGLDCEGHRPAQYFGGSPK